jgi:mono/diheme cytochrome c family protein
MRGENIINGVLNAEVGEVQFQYEIAHEKGESYAPKLFKKLRQLKKDFKLSRDRLKTLQVKEKETQKLLNALFADLTEVQSEIDKMQRRKKLLLTAKSSAETLENPIWLLRNAPIIDYLDPTLKIQQLVINKVRDDRFFVKVPKVDRCITCHLFIDQKGYEDQKNPFKTHPRLDLMVGMDSPHPKKEIGCTSCHGGEGHRVNDFNSAAHTPNDKEQEKAWVEKYGWHAPHKIPQPMYRLKDTEAACIKCHQSVEFIPQATVVNEGYRNIEKFGCYSCHKIKGFEHRRKRAPSLKKIAAKIDKEFFKNWVWAPKSFNPHTNMPSYFNQENNKQLEFKKKNIAEVNAMAEYIWNISQDYRPMYKYTGGNISKGKELISEVGCLSCHGVEGLEDQSKLINAYAGPYLNGLGSKIKDANWLVTWLRKPKHFNSDTIMPSFRLSAREANHITAYLLSLKNKKFERLKFADLDKKERDDILLTYLETFDPREKAKENLSKMSDLDRTLELGRRSISKYGCSGCHAISGHEEETGLGVELSEEGSKPVEQFGFGHVKIDHTRRAWIYNHLLNPRRWDVGVDKEFKDLLLMPNFYMTEKEAESITTVLLGMVSEEIPLEGQKRLNEYEKVVQKGMQVVNKYNCVGCHQIDGEYGDILRYYEEEDLNAGPPRLVEQGHRVHADWLYGWLNNITSIRPWLNIRMPSYSLSSEERNKIVSMFQAKAKMDTFEEKEAAVKWLPGERRGALALWKSYDCASCHTQGFNKEEPSAPNLNMVRDRLRASWIKKWLKNPEIILPGTTMPNFFEDGVAMDDSIFNGDVERQVNALTKLVLEFSNTNKSKK